MNLKDLVKGSKYKFLLQNKEVFEAIFVSLTDDFLFVKHSSGYNEGFKLSKLKSFEVLSSPKKAVKEKESVIKNAKILILHTGGTIASKVDYSTGGVSSSFTPKEILGLFPELKDYDIDSHLISNMPSDDMNFEHYNLLANKIIENKDKYKGIILTHGTDTLHYTSSALGFVLKGINIPVVLVGSQRSSDRPSSDAAINLLNAAYFIKNSKSKGVFICMHKTIDDEDCVILPAHNIRKSHSSRRDAFKPVNHFDVGVVNYKKNKLDVSNLISENYDFKPLFFNSKLKVGIILSRPNMPFDEIKKYSDYDALVLLGTGLGHMPIGDDDEFTKNNKMLEDISLFAEKKFIAISTQCMQGIVNLNVYSPARLLKKAGVLGHNQLMTFETMYIKVNYLLSNYSLGESKKLFEVNISGEIIERSVL